MAKSEPRDPEAGGFNLAGLESVPNLALMQHLQLQAQVQAQQLGYTPQQHAQLQGLLLGQGAVGLPSQLASYSAAHQQLLNSMLAQQNTEGVARSPGMHHTQSSAAMHGFDFPAAASPSPGSYSLGLGSTPAEHYQLLAAQAQAQAQDKHATDMHRLAQPSMVQDSVSQMPHGMPLAHGMGSAAHLPPAASADLAARMNAYMGGWGNASGGPMLPENPYLETSPGFLSHPDLLVQASATVRAAAAAPANLGPSPLPFGGEQRCVY